MPNERQVTEENIENARVHLKPFFGLAPGRWLAALGVLAIALALFLLLFLPGIRRPGTLYAFSSLPSEAAVFVDGAYAGTTPCEAFLSKGDHEIKIARPGFGDVDASGRSAGRLFASLLFPRRRSVEARLPLLDGEELWRNAVLEYSSWNLAGEPSTIWRTPAVLESAALARFADDKAPLPSWEERRDFVLASARVASNASAARELIRAASIVFGSGDPDSPAVADGWKKIFAGEGALASALLGLVPEEARELPGIESSKAPAARSRDSEGADAAPRIVRESRFIPVSAAGPGAFFLAEKETTVGQYAAFLRDNPRWAAGNRERLVSEGLATEDYLADYDGASPNDPVRGVSWYAARAYAEWLSKSVPAGYRVCLPSESLWEAAALEGGGTGAQVWSDGARSGPSPAGRRDGAGFADILGNLWEWCEDSFAAHPEIGLNASRRFPGSERSVRGGCWANARGTVSETTRGSFPPAWCSPFLGFRVALAAEAFK